MEHKNTIIYFVRHADSVFIPNMERERGLSEKGKEDTLRIFEVLKDEEVDLFISSPYERAIETIRGLADESKKDISIVEDLREREIGAIPNDGFKAAKKQVYEDFNYAFPYGESSVHAQGRAIAALKSILNEHMGKRLVIGTHGDIMTLMMNYFNKDYGHEFWMSSTMPDIYKSEFNGVVLERVERLWG